MSRADHGGGAWWMERLTEEDVFDFLRRLEHSDATLPFHPDGHQRRWAAVYRLLDQFLKPLEEFLESLAAVALGLEPAGRIELTREEQELLHALVERYRKDGNGHGGRSTHAAV